MKSIRSKLWLGNVLLVSLILLIIFLFQIYFLKTFYVKERTNILIDEGKNIANSLLKENTNNIREIPPEITDEISEFSSSVNAHIYILDSRNNMIYPNFVPAYKRVFKSSERISKGKNILQNKLKKDEIFVIKNLFQSKRPFVEVGVPIKNNNNKIGTVILSSPLAPIDETTSILQKQLSIIFILSLIIGTLLALKFAKLFTNPILKITEAAKKIAKGDFSTQVQINSQDEIGTLGKIINDLPVELQKNENFRKEFIANTSHELKTPISLITAYAELIRDIEGDDKSKRDKHLEVIIDEANRLNHMVEDILYLSQMEAGYDKPKRDNFLIKKTIENVIDNLKYFAIQKNIEIKINAENEDLYVNADEEKMYQVFFNIINNAISYSHENSKIDINITNNYKVEIIDYGQGIPKEDLPYIWDRFYKVDKARKRNNSSTGLGMAIVKNILENHNFKYGIESKLNQGTKVWISMK